ncbi:tyramine receptor 1-like [Actinia tenebrosa]|uniref:Tyramine receptor 1-like n=1 Tax=Actinia tenebrosa TaxID=6105 RepID=A0A6P8IFL0_ACTTE|nr:tyramine receptor 1-like [Actinia tenebrosa]
MESPTFSALNSQNISQGFRYNSTTNQEGFNELTLIQALTRKPVNLASAVFLFLLTIFSIVGNALVCRTIFVTRRLHNPGYYFVANLAVADFLVGIFPLPLTLLVYITYQMKGRWIFGMALCDAKILATIWFCSASIFSLCGVTWDRYVAVTSPLRYTTRMTNRRANCIIVTIWVMSFVFGIFNSYGIKTFPGRVICEIHRISIIYSALDLIFLWLLPITFIVYVNGKIWKAASRHTRRIQAQIPVESLRHNLNFQDLPNDVTNDAETQETHPSQSTINSTRFNGKITRRNYSIPFTFPRDKRTRNFGLKKEIKTFRTFLIVIGCFFFTWTPFFLIFMVEFFTAIPSYITFIIGLSTFLNSAYNPLIYGIFNKDFRQALYDSFKKRSRASRRINHGWTKNVQVSPEGQTVPPPQPHPLEICAHVDPNTLHF